MLEVILSTIKLDEVLIGLVGQLVNEVSAKLSFVTIKAFGLTLLGSFVGANNQLPKAKRRRWRKSRSTKYGKRNLAA